jgi:hypothetical protein
VFSRDSVANSKHALMSSSFNPLYSSRISSTEAPCANHPRIYCTVSLVPLITGFPVITLGSRVMRSSNFFAFIIFHLIYCFLFSHIKTIDFCDHTRRNKVSILVLVDVGLRLFSTANFTASVVMVADVVISMESTLSADTSKDLSSVFTRKQFLFILRNEPRVFSTSCIISHILLFFSHIIYHFQMLQNLIENRIKIRRVLQLMTQRIDPG